MLLVNLVHNTKGLREYIFVSLFFKLFGIATYNTILNDTVSYDLSQLSPGCERLNILFADTNYDDYSNFGTSKSIIISKGNSIEGAVRFPETMDDKQVKAFFNVLVESIYARLGGTSLGRFQEFYDNREQLINFFIKANPLVNWYIPLRVIKNRAFSKMTISLLTKLYQSENNPKSEYEKYARVNVGYMANHLCERDSYSSDIAWEDLISQCSSIDTEVISYRRKCFMLAMLYEESNRNIAISDMRYSESDYNYNYYSSYRRARVHEFKYNDIDAGIKYLKQTVQYNRGYYRAIYKLGMMADNGGEYDKAMILYSEESRILRNRIESGYWTPLEMEYYIKTCGRVMGLNRYFNADSYMLRYKEEALELTQKIKDNKFLQDLAEFMQDKINDTENWYSYMVNDVKMNAKEHYDKFCGKYRFN